MSRGFVREGDQEDPIVIPQRAVLPENTINYVTPNGRQELLDELKWLEDELGGLKNENETDLRRSKMLIHGRIKLLKERIASARVLAPAKQSQDQVRFGATVKFKNKALKTPQTVTIVGVDEANVSKRKIAFNTPIAIALAGAKVNDVIDFKLGQELRKLEVLQIEY